MLFRRNDQHFNPRTPCGVRPYLVFAPPSPKTFQSTHPLRGATGKRLFDVSAHLDFNPRTPCGVRPLRWRYRRSAPYFNPRTPCGVRPWALPTLPPSARFQSTHPLRGATVTVAASKYATSISIHAPLAGCDGAADGIFGAATEFQSTHPLRGATRPHNQMIWVQGISIHAPLAGCDPSTPSYICHLLRYFNPRTPCGVRLHDARISRRGCDISIHAPLAGCDAAPRRGFWYRTPISIHAPLAGCDPVAAQAMPAQPVISIHAPLAGCDVPAGCCATVAVISIHAPLAGCDICISAAC